MSHLKMKMAVKRMSDRALAPSILSADFSRLGEQVLEVTEEGAGFIHIDVMDGHFVPNISFGPVVLKSLEKLDTAPFDVHLMIETPDRYIPEFVTENTEYITVHYEACEDVDKTLAHIKSYGVGAGISIKPATDVEAICDHLAYADLVLVMSVEPGFGGQKFMPDSLDKVRELKSIREEKGFDYKIEIDGGIDTDNVKSAIDAGVDIIVAGSAVFDADDLRSRTKEFVDILR